MLKHNHIINKHGIPLVYQPSPVAFPNEGVKCCMTEALIRIKLVLSKAHLIRTAASGCIDAIINPRVGISFPEQLA